MRKLIPILAALAPAAISLPAAAQPQPVPQFKVQEIDKSLKVGYGVRLADLNADKRLDIVVADSERVIWFENPSWKLHTVVGKVSKADNVCLDVHDIDGDGKMDIALGAEWQPGNTNGGGSLQWLRQGDNIDEEWKVHKIHESEPTLHRINFADTDGDGKKELIVAPLKGRGSTQQANFMDVGARLLAFPVPQDPAKGPWEPKVLTDQFHVMHNFLPINAAGGGEQGKGTQLLTASYEGVNLVTVGPDGKASVTRVGEGDQKDSKGSRGSSEVRMGRLKGGTPIIATIEPFHGTQVVVYTPPPGSTGKEFSSGTLWARSVLDDRLVGGHAVWCADLDGDGSDEVIAGWREPSRRDVKPGINIYKATLPSDDKAGRPTWEKHVLEEGGMATEDLACADLNQDGKVDIVAVGRMTRNVRIYWNQGTPQK